MCATNFNDNEALLGDSVQLKTKAQRTSPEYAIGRMVVLTGLPESATTKSIRVRCRFVIIMYYTYMQPFIIQETRSSGSD